MTSTFAQLGAPDDLVALLARRGITSAFDIQTQVLPSALAGRDVCGRAPTGSGKTLAFGVPLAERVTKAKPFRPTALVLAPTRELATQITEELAPLLQLRRKTVAALFGGVGFGPQLKHLQRGVDVIVACPGRLADLLRRSRLTLEDVGIVVVDEADRMADMGFLPEVRRLLDEVKSDRQTMLFSATLDGAVDVLVRHYQHKPVHCEVAAPAPADDRNVHHFVRTAHHNRIAVTADLVAEHQSSVVFCRTKHGADRVAKQLGAAGVSAVAIHGNRSQAQRERALASFARRRVQVLVATDVAARGIHVDDVGCVVHFDVPADAKDYVHRSGRTGRAGAAGVVFTLVTDGDLEKVRQMRVVLGMPDPEGTRAKPARKSQRPRDGRDGGEGRARRDGRGRPAVNAPTRRSRRASSRPRR